MGSKQRWYFENYLEEVEKNRPPPSEPSDFDTFTYVDPYHMESAFHVPPPLGAGTVPPVNPFAQFTYDMCPNPPIPPVTNMMPYLVLSAAILYLLWMRQ